MKKKNQGGRPSLPLEQRATLTVRITIPQAEALSRILGVKHSEATRIIIDEFIAANGGNNDNK
ncbi:hypothetical protein [Photobacterium leiognathi]|uniref:hypothetical protein n=1 Tax=Photobacterium leiognathi TaxID=553611 RepID=UPI002981BE30|nr:hypothetical protein [Photobacterium leiognathi]